MKEQTKNWTDSTLYLTRLNSLSHPLDQETSAITSISSHPLTTGSIKTESITNTKLKSKEPNCILSVLSIMQVCSTSPDSMPLQPLADWLDGPGMTGTLTWKWIFQIYLLEKSFKLSGTELQSLSEDSQLNKSSKNTSTHLKQFSIRVLKSFLPQPVRLQSWCSLLYAHIWVAFPFLIWVTIMDTFAFVTVRFMTSLVELDKDLHFRTYPTLITQSMKMELLSVFKH